MDMERLLFLALVMVSGLVVLQLAFWLVAWTVKALVGQVRQRAARPRARSENGGA